MGALDVSKYFLTKCDEDAGDTISNLKLQKLLYYAQGFHLAIADAPLFEEPIEAWRHGPVVRQIYAVFADYKAGAIPCPADFDPETVPQETQSILDEVYEVYGQFSAWRLREMTHSEIPWQEAWDPDTGTSEISRDSMKAYFSTLIE